MIFMVAGQKFFSDRPASDSFTYIIVQKIKKHPYIFGKSFPGEREGEELD